MTDFNDFVVAAGAPSGTVKVPGVADGSTATKGFDVTLAAQALLDDASIAEMESTLGQFATATSTGGSSVPLDFGNKTKLLLTITGNVTSFALPTNAPTGTLRATDLQLFVLASGGTRDVDAAAFAAFDYGGTVAPSAAWSLTTGEWTEFALQRVHDGTNETWSAFLIPTVTSIPDASDSVKGLIELATSTEVTTGTDPVRAVTPATLTGKVTGKKTIPLAASALVPATTNGPAKAQIETTTNKVNLEVLDFDGATAEAAYFTIPMPKSYNNGQVTFEVIWTTTNTGTAGVAWTLAGGALSDNDTIDTALGTAVAVTDAGQSSNAKVYKTAESSGVTIAGTPAAGDLVVFKLARDPSNGSDTMTEDARLIGLRLFFTTNAAIDA